MKWVKVSFATLCNGYPEGNCWTLPDPTDTNGYDCRSLRSAVLIWMAKGENYIGLRDPYRSVIPGFEVVTGITRVGPHHEYNGSQIE